MGSSFALQSLHPAVPSPLEGPSLSSVHNCVPSSEPTPTISFLALTAHLVYLFVPLFITMHLRPVESGQLQHGVSFMTKSLGLGQARTCPRSSLNALHKDKGTAGWGERKELLSNCAHQCEIHDERETRPSPHHTASQRCLYVLQFGNACFENGWTNLERVSLLQENSREEKKNALREPV